MKGIGLEAQFDRIHIVVLNNQFRPNDNCEPHDDEKKPAYFYKMRCVNLERQ